MSGSGLEFKGYLSFTNSLSPTVFHLLLSLMSHKSFHLLLTSDQGPAESHFTNGRKSLTAQSL